MVYGEVYGPIYVQDYGQTYARGYGQIYGTPPALAGQILPSHSTMRPDSGMMRGRGRTDDFCLHSHTPTMELP